MSTGARGRPLSTVRLSQLAWSGKSLSKLTWSTGGCSPSNLESRGTLSFTAAMMVSHADCEERSLSIRHPVSLTSHPSVTAGRRHRHRSHLGASNYQPQNEFPFFTFTGDVEILLACGRKERRYLLHRLILCQCSAVLEDCMDGEGAHGGEGSSSSASRDAMVRYPDSAVGIPERKRWRFELDWAGRQNGFPVLVPKVGLNAQSS